MIPDSISAFSQLPNISTIAANLDQHGFATTELLSLQEIDIYRQTYDRFLDGSIRAGHLRSDLGGHTDQLQQGAENITQIMWPSHLAPILQLAPAHERALRIAKALIGEDAALDFDMLIDKAPWTNTPTPWHQDAAYWVEMPDERAVSFWIALDAATIDNGCMWFVRGSHRLPLRKHQAAGKGGGALACEADETEGSAVPLEPGHATLHTGKTLHYSRGNSTAQHRRALILNYRPKHMIELERSKGFDHGLTVNERKVRVADALADSESK